MQSVLGLILIVGGAIGMAFAFNMDTTVQVFKGLGEGYETVHNNSVPALDHQPQ